MSDEALKDLKIQLESFVATLVSKMTDEVTPFYEMVRKLQFFSKKFGPMSDSAKSWNMEPVKKYFDGDDTKKEFNAFHEQLDWIGSEMGYLQDLSAHRSGNQTVSKLITHAENYSTAPPPLLKGLQRPSW